MHGGRHGRLVADERGVGLITALMVMFVVFLSGGMWLNLAVHQMEGSARDRDRERAFAAAEAGLNAAMSRLATDATNCTDIPLTDVDGAQYEVFFDPLIDCSDPAETVRYMIARGYSPSKASERAQRRQLEQQVEIVPETGFTYALFTQPGGISASNNMTVNGDVYSDSDLTLGNYSKIFGNVVGQQSVTVANNTTIGGDVHAAGDVAITASGATIEGDVLTSGGPKPDGTQWPGNVTTKGWVKGNVQAAGTITVQTGGQIDGEQAAHSPAPPPPVRTLPTFDPTVPTYNLTYTDEAAFRNDWLATTGPPPTGFSGTYRITDSDTLSLDKNWAMDGDLMVVSDGPVQLSRDIDNLTSGDVTLAVISLSTSSEAILVTNSMTLPQDIKVLFFAPNGCVSFKQLKHFTGTVYAKCITLDNQFTLTYAPVEVPGFTWTTTSATKFTIEAHAFREVQFSG